MSLPAELTFPFECLVPSNQRTAFIQGSHRLSPKYRQALEHADLLAMKQANAGDVYEGEVFVHLKVWMPDRRKRDVSNLAKLPLDAMEGYVYEDDLQVKDLRVTEAGLDRENPRMEVRVEKRTGPDPDGPDPGASG